MLDIATIGIGTALTLMANMICLYILYKKWVLPTIREYTNDVPDKVGSWIGDFKNQLVLELLESTGGVLDMKLKGVKDEIYGAMGGHKKKANALLNKALTGQLSEEELEALKTNPMIAKVKEMLSSVQTGDPSNRTETWK